MDVHDRRSVHVDGHAHGQYEVGDLLRAAQLLHAGLTVEGQSGGRGAAPKAMMATLTIFFMKMKGLQRVAAPMAMG